jgi:mono/diheme cytochrome c family protein
MNRLRSPSFRRTGTFYALLLLCCVLVSGCENARGRPGPGPEVIRPDALLNYATLYKDNCSACHGANGSHGASIPLANSVLPSIMGHDQLRDTISEGVSDYLMPAFARSYGGTLTDQQIEVLAQGILHQSASQLPADENPPPYQATLSGDAARGQQTYTAACARCHGSNGEGNGKFKTGSIVDPTYLALVSDQYLRNIILGGRPDEDMPDYRHDLSQPLTDQQITDIVAWMASKRIADPGQPYSNTGSSNHE